MKNENKFWGGVTKSPYQTPETETINVSIEANIMSNKNGSIKDDLIEHDYSGIWGS